MRPKTPAALAASAREKLAAARREKLVAGAQSRLAAARASLPNRVTKQMLGCAAEAAFAVPLEDIAGPRRFTALQPPRRAIALLAHERLKRSFADIGHFLGGRDHSTIAHARDQAKRLLAEDPGFAARCAAIEAMLWGSDAKEPLSRVAGEGQG